MIFSWKMLSFKSILTTARRSSSRVENSAHFTRRGTTSFRTILTSTERSLAKFVRISKQPETGFFLEKRRIATCQQLLLFSQSHPTAAGILLVACLRLGQPRLAPLQLVFDGAQAEGPYLNWELSWGTMSPTLWRVRMTWNWLNLDSSRKTDEMAEASSKFFFQSSR